MSILRCIDNIRPGDSIQFKKSHFPGVSKTGFVVGILNLPTATTTSNKWFLVSLAEKCPDAMSDKGIREEVKYTYKEYLKDWFLPNWNTYNNFKFISHKSSVAAVLERTVFEKVIKSSVRATTVELI